MERRPLTGIRVLDFTWVRAGPWSTRWLAALGAEVIKIEWLQPGTGTFNMRGGMNGSVSGTPPDATPTFNNGGFFNDTNAGKLGVTMNVRSPQGIDLIKRLLAMSDIVIENFSSRVMQNWGLGYAEMTQLRPDIIYVSMAGLGQVGRNHHYQTAGPIVQALSGLTFSSGLPEEPPAGWGWSYMDDTGGMYGLMGVLTALHHRNMTGEGQHVDLSQVAAGMTLIGPAFLDLTVNGRGSRREGYPPGNRAVWPGAPVVNNYRGPIAVPHNAYRTAGGGYNDWCALTCGSDTEWQALVSVMGSPSWAAGPELGTLDGRIAQQDAIDRHIEAWTKTMGKYEVAALCQRSGVRAMPVQSTEDRVDHDVQSRFQQLYRPVFHPVLGTNLMQNFPFTLSDAPTSVDRPAPLVGEHTRLVLTGLLGLSDADVRTGFEEGVFWPKSVPMEPYLLDGTMVTPPTVGADPAPVVVDRGSGSRHGVGPLGDLRVLELTDEKGQWAGKLMADLGADVIKVEPPQGATERHTGPFYQDTPHPERSLHFWHYNTSKRGITLNLESEAGRDVLRRLVATTDVLLETFAPGYLPSLGLGYEQLRELNPRLIMCSLTGFGQAGPWHDYAGSDLVHLAAGGQMACCGYDESELPDAPPIAPGGGNAWHMGSHYAYIAIMAALAHRDFTGRGQYIDASVHGACSITTEPHVPTWIYRKEMVKRQTGRHASAQPSPRTQFRCKDGAYINSGALFRFTPETLKLWAEWMERHGLAQDLLDPKYQEAATILAEQSHIAEVLEHFFANITAEEAYHGAQERGSLAGAVRSPEEILNDPHWADRGFFVEIEHPELGRTITYPGLASIYEKSPGAITRRAPLLGEHNVDVYDELGLTEPERAAIREANRV